jgi:hypothetical protein
MVKAFDSLNDKVADRYAIVFDAGNIYFMSDDANMPNGYCQYGGTIDEYNNDLGIEVEINCLPTGTQRQINYLLSLDEDL